MQSLERIPIAFVSKNLIKNLQKESRNFSEIKLSADVLSKNLITNLQVFSLLPLPSEHTVFVNIECKINRKTGIFC
jgi:hypothetical protein